MLLNADTQESFRLLNDRMAYVALSRARDEALIYTDSVPNLRETLSRAADKEMALDAIGETSRDKQQERNDLTNDPLAPHLLPRSEQSLNKTQPTLKQHRRKPPSLPLMLKKSSSQPPRC